jgi:protein subunit release factor B
LPAKLDREGGRRRPPLCYTRKEREQELEREARRVTESRLMEEEARYRQEEHDRRRRAGEHVPLTEKVKEMVGSR